MEDRNCKNHSNPVEENGFDTVTVQFDNNNVVECIVYCTIPVDGRHYVALLPVDEINNEESRTLLYRLSDINDENPQLESIEDDDEYEAVADAYDEWLDTLEYEAIDLDALGLDAL
ncbi:MAG: DUF1292 domain-containing protein [Schaedlerella sp.]|nr:DUF1292 domain-containing protein [Schaedlerella sp.]